METRYLIAVHPSGRPSPEPLPGAHRTVFDLGDFQALLDTPAAPPIANLSVAHETTRRRLTFTEGIIIEHGDRNRLQSGSYNQVIIDAAAGELRLHCDTMGVWPCYFAPADGIMRVSNSLRLLRRAAGLPLDDLGIAQTFLSSGWAIYERTILDGARRAAPGTEYGFRLDSDAAPRVTRLAGTWTTIDDQPRRAVLDRFVALWESAIERHFGPVAEPVAVLLSGGLDSRLVMGGLAALGKEVVGVTHGDRASDEVRIAGEAAAAVGARWITSDMDDDFPFERLALERVNRLSESLVNPMWDYSAQLVSAAGVAWYTTGAGFDFLFGGQADADKRVRLMKNLRHATLGPGKAAAVSAEGVAQLAGGLIGQARKRARTFRLLLAEPYRGRIEAALPAMHEELEARLSAIAATTPTLPQVFERFYCETRVRQFSPMQERQLLPYGSVLMPTYDRDLLAYITNLPPGMKYDHQLYYPAFRRLYPRLARIQVTNLGIGVDKPQLIIEMNRAVSILRHKRLTSWVNFEEWISGGGRLAMLENCFLAADHFFDPDGVRAYFAAIRDGTRRIYDGNEVFGFLSLAMLLDERRLAE